MTIKYHGRNLRQGRVSLSNQIYLVTAVTAERKAIFSEFIAGRALVNELLVSETRGRATTLAYVVMPDHLHWLLSLGAGNTLTDVVGNVKRYSATAINKILDRAALPLWQRGFHDHALRHEEDIQHIARYIVANPLRAGLVRRVGDYPLWDAIWL